MARMRAIGVQRLGRGVGGPGGCRSQSCPGSCPVPLQLWQPARRGAGWTRSKARSRAGIGAWGVLCLQDKGIRLSGAGAAGHGHVNDAGGLALGERRDSLTDQRARRSGRHAGTAGRLSAMRMRVASTPAPGQGCGDGTGRAVVEGLVGLTLATFNRRGSGEEWPGQRRIRSRWPSAVQGIAVGAEVDRGRGLCWAMMPASIWAVICSRSGRHPRPGPRAAAGGAGLVRMVLAGRKEGGGGRDQQDGQGRWSHNRAAPKRGRGMG